jgi:hypothetical protein
MSAHDVACARQPQGFSWVLLAATVAVSCRPQGPSPEDPEAPARRQWVHEQTAAHNVYLREFLNGTPEMQFYDGWYDIENDADTGGAWRWQGGRSITRLRTTPGGTTGPATDMRLIVYGWVPYENAEELRFRSLQMEFAVNGHVLERWDPPPKEFSHSLFVPKELLDHSDWVDFAITVANTVHTRGDWRDLGFATTGFVWKQAGPG